MFKRDHQNKVLTLFFLYHTVYSIHINSAIHINGKPSSYTLFTSPLKTFSTRSFATTCQL